MGIKFYRISPCPEKFGWDTPPSEDMVLYFEVKEYGYVCIEFHPYIEVAYLHAIPYENFTPKLKNIIAAVNEIEKMLLNCNIKIFACSYDKEPSDAVKKLIIKHLHFIPINKYTYIKILKEDLWDLSET